MIKIRRKEGICLEKSFEYGFGNSLDHAVFVTLIGAMTEKRFTRICP